MLCLNSTSYSFHWRPNAGPDRPCWDPLGCVFCSPIFKKFWSLLFWKIINLPGQSINNLQHCSQMWHRPDGQLTTTERWMPTQKKPKHWHKILENIPSAKSSSPREARLLLLHDSRSNQGRLKMFSQEGHIHRSNTYMPYIRTYIWLDIQILDTEHSYLILLLDMTKQGKGPQMAIYLCI